MTNFLKLIVITILALLSACGGGGDSLEDKKTLLEEKRKKAEKIEAEIRILEKEIAQLDPNFKRESNQTLVTTIDLKKQDFSSFLEVKGTVESDKNVILNAETNGVVKYIAVQEGQRVGAGQLLVSQSSQVLQSNIAEVKKAMELADIVFERQKKLWDQKIGTEIQYLEAKNNKERLDRQLATLQSQVGLSSVTAPFSGVVDEVFIKKGQNAGPGSQLLRLVSSAQVQIVAEVAESHLGKVNKGDMVTVKIPSIDYKKQVPITLIGETINPENRTFRIELAVPNNDGKLKPDMLATVEIKEDTRSNAVVVPTNLIQQDKAGDYIYITTTEDGKTVAKMVRIKKGETYDNKTLVLKGLKGTETLIDKGFRNVTDGIALKIVENEDKVKS